MQAIGIDLEFEDQPLHGTLLDLQEHENYTDLADYLYNTCRSDLTVSSFLIVRPPVFHELKHNADWPKRLTPVLHRSPGIPVYILGSRGYEHVLEWVKTEDREDVLQSSKRGKTLIDQLRQQELRRCAEKSNALLRTTGGTYFRAPSRRFCQTFLRVGNIQHNRSALDAVFFWLLPRLKDCHAIVTETWTISSLALNAARLLERYQHGKRRCRVDMLSEYHDGTSDLVATTRRVLERVNRGRRGRKLVILISSCMTGNLAERLRGTLEQVAIPLEDVEFVALYSLSDGHGVSCLCDLSTAFGPSAFAYRDTIQPEDGEQIRIFDIDRNSYFPLRIEEALAPISKQCLGQCADFFTDYADCSPIHVHRDCVTLDGQRLRHHGIYVDVATMCRSGRFLDRFSRKLELERPLPKLIVIPPHHAGYELASIAWQLLFERHGFAPEVIVHPDLTSLGRADVGETSWIARLQNCGPGDEVLVLDDVSISGRRLSRYSQSLRELGFRGRARYLVGVARPTRSSIWNERIKFLRWRRDANGRGLPPHSVDFVEFVVLPDWDTSGCPWCREFDFLRKLLDRLGELPRWLADRLLELQDVSGRSLAERTFLLPPGHDPISLGPNSIFAPPAAPHQLVFSAIACALQRMRIGESPSPLASRGYPEIGVLQPADYLGEGFSETCIRASILRAAKRHELERSGAADEQMRTVMTHAILLSNDPAIVSLAAELLFAIFEKKLPPEALTEDARLCLGRLQLDKMLAAIP